MNQLLVANATLARCGKAKKLSAASIWTRPFYFVNVPLKSWLPIRGHCFLHDFYALLPHAFTPTSVHTHIYTIWTNHGWTGVKLSASTPWSTTTNTGPLTCLDMDGMGTPFNFVLGTWMSWSSVVDIRFLTLISAQLKTLTTQRWASHAKLHKDGRSLIKSHGKLLCVSCAVLPIELLTWGLGDALMLYISIKTPKPGQLGHWFSIHTTI